MPRYKLRTLLIALAILPPLLAGGWAEYKSCVNRPPTCVVPPYTGISGTTNAMSNQLSSSEAHIARMIEEREAKASSKTP
jgi:hypothetical protein